MTDPSIWSGGSASTPSTFPVTVVQGGTGATTEADARTNLQVYSKAEVDSSLDLKVSQDSSTGHAQLPSGTTAERTGSDGAIRYNVTTLEVEIKKAATWATVLTQADLGLYLLRDGSNFMTGAITFDGDSATIFDGIGHSGAGTLDFYITGDAKLQVSSTEVTTSTSDGFSGYGHKLLHVGGYVASPRKVPEVTTRYYGPVGLQIDGIALLPATYSGKLLLVPFQPHSASHVTGVASFSGLAVNVTTLVAGKSILLGVYGDDGYGAPGALLYTLPAVSFATTGVKDAVGTVDLTVLTGNETFWLAFHTDSTATGIVTACNAGNAAFQQSNSLLGTSAPGTLPYVGYTYTTAYTGTLPDTLAGLCTPTNVALPCIWAKAT